MKSLELRKKFFEFFKNHGHTIVPSSSLVPADDPTLLFANAGMNQFKDVFLGKEKKNYTRAASIQKCIRAGGKHDDLENVGVTKRHLTFFEMMGNFSFGDYFKKEAISFAWEFVTTMLKLPKEKLYATVYEFDDESYDIWNKVIGLPPEHIYRLGAHDNFWQMGDTGPCGPCSEIYIDRGVAYSCGKSDCAPGCSCERFLEFWNLVFMQFDRQEDGTDLPLGKKGVDTGMGLERLSVIMQNVDSVFETDLFIPLITTLENLTGISYQNATESQKIAFRVLSDHIRSASLAIADGALPSNEGRGYVIRKIIRRAALFSQRLTEKYIFPDLAESFIEQFGSIYPELIKAKDLIKKLLTEEIEKFAANLLSGQTRLKKYLEATKETKIITGEQAFKLYDTYGFPLELTLDIAKEYGYTIDTQGFKQEMEQQKIKSGKKETRDKKISLPENTDTRFTGYETLTQISKIKAIIHDNEVVQNVPKGTDCWVITEESPFFVEKGGQVSDQGIIRIAQESARLKNLKWINNAIAANIIAPENIKVGDSVEQHVDEEFRLNTMKNHTATHLLQGALIQILGPQVRQSGSLVTADYLRFDFTYAENLTSEQVIEVERLVNQKIMENIPTSIFESTYKDAINKGVIAIFDEKYNPERVRVVEIPGFSSELCGGTHVQATGDIGCFKITDISALSVGNRRVVAVTGPQAIKLFQDNFSTVKFLAQEFKVKPDAVIDAIDKQKELLKQCHKEMKDLKKKFISTQLPVWLESMNVVNEIPYLFLLLEELSVEDLREVAQRLSEQKPGFYFFVSNAGKRSIFYTLASKEFQDKIDLNSLADLLKEVELRGGGSKGYLQGGGPAVTKEINLKIQKWLERI